MKLQYEVEAKLEEIKSKLSEGNSLSHEDIETLLLTALLEEEANVLR